VPSMPCLPTSLWSKIIPTAPTLVSGERRRKRRSPLGSNCVTELAGERCVALATGLPRATSSDSERSLMMLTVLYALMALRRGVMIQRIYNVCTCIDIASSRYDGARKVVNLHTGVDPVTQDTRTPLG
jgi:hypothetical protein